MNEVHRLVQRTLPTVVLLYSTIVIHTLCQVV